MIRLGEVISMEAKSRSTYLDLIKACAIILVVIGHCIQYGSGSEYFLTELYFDNLIFKSIYSFHMPLFALISGHLFYYTLSRRGTASALRREVKSVLIPVLAWSASYYLIFRGQEILDSGLILYVKNLIKFCLTDIWFLWAVFWCSLAIIAINKFFKDNLIAYGVLMIFLLFIPEKMNSHYYIFLYPYFVFGYLWNKHNLQEKVAELFSKKRTIFLLCLLVLWIVLLTQFNYDSFIYTTHISLYGKQWKMQLAIDIYRWVIGFAGSAMILAWGGTLQSGIY